MDTQALIPPALAAIHNFIWQYDPQEICMYDDQLVDFKMGHHPRSARRLKKNAVTPNEVAQANERRNGIAHNMWEQYQHYLEDDIAPDE